MLTWFAQKSSTRGVRPLAAHLLDITHVLARAGVPGYRQAVPLLSMEFERARRYQHALSLALFGTDGLPGATTGHGRHDAELPGGHGLFPALLASVLREGTRQTDIVTYTSMLGRCIVLMPETDRGRAEQAVRRLRDLAVQRLLTPVATTLASFPGDGLVLDDLLRFAAAQPQAALETQPGGDAMTAPAPANSALSSA